MYKHIFSAVLILYYKWSLIFIEVSVLRTFMRFDEEIKKRRTVSVKLKHHNPLISQQTQDVHPMLARRLAAISH